MLKKRNNKSDTAHRWDPTKKGISPSFIKNFLECKQSTLIRWVQGWKSSKFKAAPASGIMGHNYLQKIREGIISGEYKPKKLPTRQNISEMSNDIMEEYLEDSGRLTNSEKEGLEFMCGQLEIVLFHYCRYYVDDFDKKKNVWTRMEEYFKHPCVLSDGSEWALGGFKDAVKQVLLNKVWKLAIEETKFKAKFTESSISETLRFDTQVMLYSNVLLEQNPKESEVLVDYNIVRRPNLKLGKTETWADYFARLEKDVADRPEHYFCRLQLRNRRAAVEQWKKDFLLKVMDEIQWWWNDGHPEERSYIDPDSLSGNYGHSDCYDIIVYGDYSMFKRKELKNASKKEASKKLSASGRRKQTPTENIGKKFKVKRRIKKT